MDTEVELLLKSKKSAQGDKGGVMLKPSPEETLDVEGAEVKETDFSSKQDPLKYHFVISCFNLVTELGSTKLLYSVYICSHIFQKRSKMWEYFA